MLAAVQKVKNMFKSRPVAELSLVEDATYRSKFGGLWTDRVDANALLEKKIAAGNVSEEMAEKLRFWMEHGYVILENAVDHDLIDALNAEINEAWETGDDRFKVQTGHGDYLPLSQADRSSPLTKFLDSYVYSDNGRKVAFSPAIHDFITTVFERNPICFQNLTFEMGSTQAIHQDTAYVVCSSPMELVASWVALEDIQEGSGELQYYPGSHNFSEFNFGDPNRKHWNNEIDGNEIHQDFLKSLHDKAKAMGLDLQTFRPKKGDALIWSADLAHGGGPITDTSLSRKSYVCHYCPEDVNPHYFSYAPQHKTKVDFEGKAEFTSSHYILSNSEDA